MRNSVLVALALLTLSGICVFAVRVCPIRANGGAGTSGLAQAPVFVHRKVHIEYYDDNGKVTSTADSELWNKLPDKSRIEDPTAITVQNGAARWQYFKKSKEEHYADMTNHPAQRTAEMFKPDYTEKNYRAAGASVSKSEGVEVTLDKLSHRVIYLDVEHVHANKDGSGRELGPIRHKIYSNKDTGCVESDQEEMYDLQSGKLLVRVITTCDYPKYIPDNLFTPGVTAGR